MDRLHRQSKKEQQGQVVIVVILVMLVVSLIILAVTSRSITDVGISRTSDDSARAFSAAEAGIDAAVQRINEQPTNPAAQTAPVSLSSGATYTYDITPAVGSLHFLSPSPLASDIATLQVYLANKENLSTGIYTGTSICLLWGNEGTTPGQSDTPAIEASVLYRNASGQMAVRRFAIDPNGRSGLTSVNNSCTKTSQATDNNLGVARTFAFSHQLSSNLPAGSSLAMLRLRLLFSAATAHYVGVAPQVGSSLPAQGYKISSTGTTGGATRKVEVFQAYPSLPALFDFALFNGSGNAITK